MEEKRYTTWRDETFWKKSAVDSGLVYGVYDNEKERKCTDKEQGGVITSYDDALKRVNEMNKKKG